MTDQEYCRKMAELEGWMIRDATMEHEGRYKYYICKPEERKGFGIYVNSLDDAGIPDYRKDLNAQVRVAEILCGKLGKGYTTHLIINSFTISGKKYYVWFQQYIDAGKFVNIADTPQEALWLALCKVIDYLEEQG